MQGYNRHAVGTTPIQYFTGEHGNISGASFSVLSYLLGKNVPESHFVHFLNINKGCSYSN